MSKHLLHGYNSRKLTMDRLCYSYDYVIPMIISNTLMLASQLIGQISDLERYFVRIFYRLIHKFFFNWCNLGTNEKLTRDGFRVSLVELQVRQDGTKINVYC